MNADYFGDHRCTKSLKPARENASTPGYRTHVYIASCRVPSTTKGNPSLPVQSTF